MRACTARLFLLSVDHKSLARARSLHVEAYAAANQNPLPERLRLFPETVSIR